LLKTPLLWFAAPGVQLPEISGAQCVRVRGVAWNPPSAALHTAALPPAQGVVHVVLEGGGRCAVRADNVALLLLNAKGRGPGRGGAAS